jgi:hypothetical protein
MGQEFIAHLSRFNRFPVTNKQGMTEPLFEPFYLPTDSRLGQMESRCCTSKAPGLDDCSQGSQRINIESHARILQITQNNASTSSWARNASGLVRSPRRPLTAGAATLNELPLPTRCQLAPSQQSRYLATTPPAFVRRATTKVRKDAGVGHRRLVA